jgi:S1-C subfamily serine protease
MSYDMKTVIYGMMALVLSPVLRAEDDIPLLLPEEKRAVEAQSQNFNRALTPTLERAAKSTVRVWAGSRRLAYGTVVGDGSRVLSKWSEVARSRGGLRVDNGDEARSVRVVGVYPDEDLALLEVEGERLMPVEWSVEAPQLGSFLAAPQPDGRLAAFGVVSVLERNLRDTDLAYLGVVGASGYTGPGVRVANVAEDSGAAVAGLKRNDVILKVAEREISGLLELKNALIGLLPGQSVPLTVETAGKPRVVEVLLGNRPKMEQMFGARLQQMERMGGDLSQVRTSFTRAIQTDMRPTPSQIGGPVVDLQGRVVGLTLARADRTRSFVMPAAAVIGLLEKEPMDPVLADVRRDEPPQRMVQREDSPRGGGAPRPRSVPPPNTEERMRRHLSDMERLMEHLRGELDALEQGR